MSALEALNVEVVLNDRLDLSTLPQKPTHSPSHLHPIEKVVRTQGGRQLRADLILLCTGQTPNTSIMKEAIPEAVGPTGEVKVLRTLQVAVSVPPPPPTPAPAPSTRVSSAASLFIPPECPSPGPSPSTTATSLPGDWDSSDAHLYAPYPHMFAIGDAADAWGALKAGHNAFYQAEVAARNIVRLIRREMKAAISSSSSSRSSSPVSENEGTRVDDHFSFRNEDHWQEEAIEEMSDGSEGSVQEEFEVEEEELERYLPGPPAIKLSVGLTKAVYQINGKVGRKEGMNEDLDALLMWAFYGHEGDIEETRA